MNIFIQFHSSCCYLCPIWIYAVFQAFCCFIVSYGEHWNMKWSQYSSVFCIMPHFSLIILHTPIWGRSWSLNCILNHYFRFILKWISEQTQTVIFILMEVRQWRKNLPKMGDFWPFACTPWLQNMNNYSLINMIKCCSLIMSMLGGKLFVQWCTLSHLYSVLFLLIS